MEEDDVDELSNDISKASDQKEITFTLLLIVGYKLGFGQYNIPEKPELSHL